MEGPQEIDLSWLPKKTEGVDLGFLPPPKSAEKKKKKDKKYGLGYILGETLKGTAQDIVAPIEAAVRTVAGIPAFGAGLATTIGAQAVSGGDWEKAGELGKKVSGFLSGGESTLSPKTPFYQETLAPLMAPFNIALEEGPRAMAPNEPKTQAMLGAGAGVAMLLLPYAKGEVKAKFTAKLKSGAEITPKDVAEIAKAAPEAPPEVVAKAAPKPKSPRGAKGAKKAPAVRDVGLIAERRGPGRLSDADWAKAQADAKKNAEIIRDKTYEQFQAGKEPEPPLSITSSAMGMGLDEFVGKQAKGEIIGIVPQGAMPPTKYSFVDPATEARFQAAKGIKGPSIGQKISEFAGRVKNQATRTYEYLPNDPRFYGVKNDLKILEKQKAVSIDRTLRIQRGALVQNDPIQHDLFTRKVILDDLRQEAAAGRDLPFGFTKDTVTIEGARIDAEVAKWPQVQQSLVNRKQVWDGLRAEYTAAQEAIGFDVGDRFAKEDYFRHQVLEHAAEKSVRTTGKRLRVPTSRSFLKRRAGSELDINTDYLQAETEVMAQMMVDTEIARTLNKMKPFDIANQVKAEALAAGVKDWKERIPEGYATWQPREGNVFYLAKSIPERLAEQIASDMLEGTVSPEQIKTVLAVGKPRSEWVIPEELVATLDNLTRTKGVLPPLKAAAKKAQTAWKVWTLISPRKVFKYNARNLSGDAEAVFVGNPSAFLKAPRAVKELYDLFKADRPMTPEMKEWFPRGGVESTLQAQELGDISSLGLFRNLYERGKGGIQNIPANIWRGYWKTARLTTDFRESILRYSAFLDYLDQMKANPKGFPKNFGASLPDEVMALTNPYDRAFRLSNELLGAYDEISVMGHSLRDYWYPFWSWKEVNFKRYIRLMKNAARDGNIASTVGKSLAIKAPVMALRVGRFAVKAACVWSMLEAWNHLRYPELEAGLSEDQRKQPHIILGQDKDGKTVYFSRLGMLGDFVEWFGLDTLPAAVHKMASGRMSPTELALNMAKSPINQMFQGMSPFYKAPFEYVLRKQLFPDVFDPRTIRDRGLYLAQSLGLDNEYRNFLSKLPRKPYGESLSQLLVYKQDPEETAYYETREMVREKMKDMGRSGAGDANISPRGNALYYLRLAHKWKDAESEQRFLREYINYSMGEENVMGKTPDEALKSIVNGLASSLRNMHPLAGLNQEQQLALVQSLPPEDREKVARAIAYYNDTLVGGIDIGGIK